MTNNREELFARFVECLEVREATPEFLGTEPESPPPEFDPFQMVGEWIALRHEVKQQGKLLRSTQDALQKALEVAEADREKLQTRLTEQRQNIPQQNVEGTTAQLPRFNREKELFLRDLLNVVDALDRACDHWQNSAEVAATRLESLIESRTSNRGKRQLSAWKRFRKWLASLIWSGEAEVLQLDRSLEVQLEVFSGAREGVELIRRMLLDTLRQQQVLPMDAKGQPFNSEWMYAIGREKNAQFPDNTVLQEVVRGYLWRDGAEGVRVLREAQVIVCRNER